MFLFLQDLKKIYFHLRNFIFDIQEIFNDNQYHYNGMYVKNKFPKTFGTKIK